MARTRETDDAQILAAARKIFVSNGLSASVRDIAASIGISEGVVFQRFGSKMTLIDAALAPGKVDLDGVVARAAGHPDPARAFEDVAAALFSALRQDAPVMLPAVDRAGGRPAWCRADGLFLRCVRALTDYMRREQDAGRIASGVPDAAAFLLAGALHHAALFEAAGGPTPHVNEQAVRRMARVAWRGITAAG